MFTILLYFHDLPRFVITCVRDFLEICWTYLFFNTIAQQILSAWPPLNICLNVHKFMNCDIQMMQKVQQSTPTYVHSYSDSVPQWTHTTLRINHLYLFPFKKICSICIVRELFTSDIDLMESESKVVFATREGRRSDEPGHGVFKTIFEPESSEKGLKVSC